MGQFILPVSVKAVLMFITDHLGNIDSKVDQCLVDKGVKARLGTHSISTIKRRLASLAVAHKIKAVNNPVSSDLVKETLKKANKALVIKSIVKKRRRLS